MDDSEKLAKLERLRKLKRLKELRRQKEFRDLKAQSINSQMSIQVNPYEGDAGNIIPQPAFEYDQKFNDETQLLQDLKGGDDSSGFKRGMLDVGQGAKQLALNTTPKGSQEYTDKVNQEIADYENTRGVEKGSFDFPRLAGNAAALMPLALASPGAAAGIGGRVLANGLIGAGAGLASFDPTNTLKNKAMQTAGGGIGGAVLPEAAAVVARQGATTASRLLNKAKRVPDEMVKQATKTGDPALVRNARRQLDQAGELDPGALKRKALYERLDLDHTSAQVTRDPAQWQLEAELAKNQNNPNLRNALISGNKQLINKVDDLAENISPQAKTPYELGSKVDEAIVRIDKKLQGKVDKAYKKAASALGVDDVADTDLFSSRVDDVYEKFEDVIPSPINKRIKEFLPTEQIDENGIAVMVDPKRSLTVKEGERAIKLINARISKSTDKSELAALNGLSRSVRDTLDDMGQLSDQAAPLFKKARAKATNKFIAESPNGIKNMLEGKTTPEDYMKKHIVGGKVDDIKGTIDYLNRSSEGKEVLSDIKAETVRHLLNKGTQGHGVDGEFKGRLFKKAVESTRDKLTVLFSPSEIQLLDDIAEAGFNMTSQPAFSYVNNSNTSSAIINALQGKASRGALPVVGDLLEERYKSSVANKAINEALSGSVINKSAVAGKKAARDQLINRLSRGAIVPAIPALHKELGR